MKKILIIHTGGTISMSEDKDDGTVLQDNFQPFADIASFRPDFTSIEEEVLFYLPSPQITPLHMLELGKRIEEKTAEPGIDGVVVTHGTDTLEETAYFLDLYLTTSKAVVITGAMRPGNQPGADGLYNLLSALRVAASAHSCEKGVLVVMNDEIHTARNVTKVSTSNVAAFQSLQYGPIGLLTRTDVLFHYPPAGKEAYPVEKISKNVALVKAFAGMGSPFLEAVRHSGIDGLVIEGFGQGNLPKETVPAIRNFRKANIPVVMVSRSCQGMVQPVYGYEGGGRQLKATGVIFTNGLTGPKARIKLLLALEIAIRKQRLEHIFQK